MKHRLVAALRANAATLLALAEAFELGETADTRTHIPIREAAKIANVSQRTISREVMAGKISASGTKRTRIVERASLDAWIAKRAVRVPSSDDELEAAVDAKMEAAE